MNFMAIQLALISGSMVITAAMAGLVFLLWYRGSKRLDQITNNGALLVKASCHNTKQLREIENSVHHIHDNGLEMLAFQKKANDHQRILLASLNLQTQKISDMLSSQARPDNSPARIEQARGPASVVQLQDNGMKTRVIGAASNEPVGVVSLENWIARSSNAGAAREIERQPSPAPAASVRSRIDPFIEEITQTAEEAVRQHPAHPIRQAQVVANG